MRCMNCDFIDLKQETKQKARSSLRTIFEAVALLIVSRKEQKKLSGEQNKFVYHKHLVHKLVNNHILKCSLNHDKCVPFCSIKLCICSFLCYLETGVHHFRQLFSRMKRTLH